MNNLNPWEVSAIVFTLCTFAYLIYTTVCEDMQDDDVS